MHRDRKENGGSQEAVVDYVRYVTKYEYMFPWRLDLVIGSMSGLINCINTAVSVS